MIEILDLASTNIEAPCAKEDWLFESLEEQFGHDFSIIASGSGERLHREKQAPFCDAPFLSEIARGAPSLQQAEIIWEEDAIAILAIPLHKAGSDSIAMAAFLIQPVEDWSDLASAAAALDVQAEPLQAWAAQQEVWPVAILLRMANAALETLVLKSQNQRLNGEVEDICENLSLSYEEINVLYGITQNLQISKRDEELGQLALDKLLDVIPAQCLAIQFYPKTGAADVAHLARSKAITIFAGETLLNEEKLNGLIEQVNSPKLRGPLVLNRRQETDSEWQYQDMRQVIMIPLVSDEQHFGWLAAINHRDNIEFGSVEASLLSSVAAILGIHCGNVELFREQAELLANVVKALTSAIDAKDPYTCGHSDRVARISVKLAEALNCDAEELKTIYMGGLLHDVGKIGIDDNIIRKPGRLTAAEFTSIKRHPKLGHSILSELKQLRHVLPVVLHHHEQWDGKGYPHQLKEEEIPQLARIVAVADAFDAMTSDRPYRKGMPREKVEAIFRDGAGKQWDANVIDAFFQLSDTFFEISETDRALLDNPSLIPSEEG